jgi:hypothetical protein
MIKINLHACAAFVQALKFSILNCCINGAAMSTSCQDDVATYQTLRHIGRCHSVSQLSRNI